MSAATQESNPVKSGAAGAATFPGSDSRKFNYFEPKGRKATHYEDMTVDVQPDPERYLLQDWIISFPDGTPTYSKNWTKALSSNWHQFRSRRSGMGAHPLSAAVHDLRHGAGRHRKRAQVRGAKAHGQDLGQDPAR